MFKKPKMILLFILALFVITNCISLITALAATYIPQNSNRVVLNFNTNWLYTPSDVANGGSPTLDDSSFQQVCLPHSNKVLSVHKNTLNLADYRFVSWYRRHFSIPSTYSGRRILVEFQAVTAVADVYVNGAYVGQHKGAYTPFTFDITSYVSVGGADNLIAVRVDSTKRTDVPPEVNSEWIDYLLFGGIPRDVHMIITDPLHVDWTFVNTPAAPGTSWDNCVRVQTKVLNSSAASKSVTVIANIVDTGNNVVATTSTTANIAANSSYTFNQTTPAITSPHLWSPDDPYLHTVFIQVKDGANFVDEYKVKVGLRWIDFNKTDGKFWINGQSLKLRGLDRHETFPWIGRSAPDRMQRKDADILKYDLGCNIMRCSHYPNDPEFLDRCDEIGLLVLEETPGWQNLGDQNWKNIVIQNVEEMVMRDRNHPCVVTWGVRVNESGDDSALYTSTNNKARSLDSTRPTCGVRNFTTSQFLEDLYTFNDFSGGITAPTQQPWLVTEFAGHTFPTHSYDAEQRLIDHALKHAYIQNEQYKNAQVSGAMGWCAFDYNTTNLFGDPTNTYVCYHGVSDMFRLPKFAAYFYQSQRDGAKYGYMTYIANYWKNGSPTTVTVFSNCPQVELFVNGVSKGIKSPTLYTNLPHGVFQWTGVTYAAGNLRADGKNGSTTVATFTRYTPGGTTKLVLTPDSTSLIADGGDMTRVVVTAVDSNNQIVPLASNSVSFSVTGAGKFLGENPLVLEDGKGCFFVQSKLNQTGTITCTATASGLTSGNATITASAMTEAIVPTSGGTIATPTPTTTPVGTNLALNKTASADSEETGKGNVAANGNDGNTTTRWCANDGNFNHWWKVDLGASYSLTGSEVMWELSGIVYQYMVEISTDNANWTLKVDKRGNAGTSQIQTDGFSATARYIRITVTGISGGKWASFFEFRVFGSGGGSTPTPTPTRTPTPTSGTTTVNDNTTGTSNNQFEYVGAWSYGTQSGAYNNDNHWSNSTNAYYQVRFNGTRIKLYGAKAAAHGIAGVSIDGGAETNVDYYSATRADNVLLYTSPTLTAGQHTLKVRVTGTKNASSTDYHVTADRVDITN